jgi:nucleoside-diphosphate-sugar epimerase
VAAVVRERLGSEAPKVPKRTAPNLLIRAVALFDGSIRSVVGDLGKRSWVSSDKARSALGWTTRPVEDSIEETARSLL